MLRVLSWDTTGVSGQIAAADGCTGQTAAWGWTQEKSQSEALFTAVVEICDRMNWKRESVQGLGVVVGPGSFTGLRVGIAVARAWKAIFPHVKSYSISSLELQHLASSRPGVGVIRPAATGEFYVRTQHDATGTDADGLVAMQDWRQFEEREQIQEWIAEGHLPAIQQLRLSLIQAWNPEALLHWTQRIADEDWVEVSRWVPHYLREPDAVRKRGLSAST